MMTMKTLMRLKVSQFAAAAILAAASGPAPAQTALEFNPAETKVEFTLGDVLHTVHGTFALKRGNLRFDPATGVVSGELVVDATTGASGSGARDKRMHANVLESTRFPEIVFRPDRVEGTVAPQGPSKVQMHGMFGIHGAEHEIVMPLEVNAKDGVYTATATFAVPYVKWGMKDPSNLILKVKDHVDIVIRTVARPARERTTN